MLCLFKPKPTWLSPLITFANKFQTLFKLVLISKLNLKQETSLYYSHDKCDKNVECNIKEKILSKCS
jgi:hypothetical protein